MDIRPILEREFHRRATRNRRYSMRAYARSLELHHSALSRIIQGHRGVSDALLLRLGLALGLTSVQLTEALAFERGRKLLQLSSAPGFRADTRWIAARTGMDLDDVQRSLHLLLHHRKLLMHHTDHWSASTDG